MAGWRRLTLLGCLAGSASVASAHGDTPDGASYAELSLEELADVVITSVSRRPQALAAAAASIHVITAEDIRRSGAITLPEALRLAPTLHVAAVNGHEHAISSRGFTSTFGNKLLVMIDGRTVYSPLFSGVFWDAQDLILDDVAQIEVISGPGGVAWGTNAVNGIINILTKPAAETQGTLATVVAGDRERGLAARHGAALGESGHVRVYAKGLQRDAGVRIDGTDAADGWRRTQAGFRADWSSGRDLYTLQGDAYRGRTDDRPMFGSLRVQGANLLARWTRRVSDSADFDLQAYQDQTERIDQLLLQERARLFDVEAKGRLVAGAHRWLVGAGYRRAADRSDPGVYIAFVPPAQSLRWYSVFVQDEIRLSPRLQLTLGTRFERNPYTGWETLPSARLGWTLFHHDLLWAGLSRAVRSPSRLDRELVFPPQPPYQVRAGGEFRSELATTAELGYRGQPHASLAWALTGFATEYRRLRSLQVDATGVTSIQNRIEGQVRGLEATAQWQVRPGWRLRGGVVLLDESLRLAAGGNDPNGPGSGRNDPSHQWSLRSHHAVHERLEVEAAVRHVAALPRPTVPAYTAVDLRMAWLLRSNLELSFVARNAFDAGHVEFRSDPYTTEIPRSLRLGLRWTFR